MKLLFDENLSHKLADNLSDVYPKSVHVRNVGLKGADDTEVWDYVDNELTIFTIPNAGHFVQQEAHKKVNKMIKMWLEKE